MRRILGRLMLVLAVAGAVTFLPLRIFVPPAASPHLAAAASPSRTPSPPPTAASASPALVTAAELSTPPPLAKPPAAAGPRRVIALDIGHTIALPGATSASGVPEFEFNRRIVRRIEERLRTSSSLEPVVINPAGHPITLSERARRAELAGAALLISIHHDSVADKYLQTQNDGGRKLEYCDRFKGFGVFVSGKGREPARSLAFARLLGVAMQAGGFEFSPHHHEPIRGENRPIADAECGVYQYDDLIVLKSASMPAVLLECGVIVHREQEVLLSAPLTQQMIAEAVVVAIERYFSPPR